jgi:hypothetical protein
MVIKNAGGPGVLTVNNGILVVQVLNPTLSDPRAFSLSGGRVTAARLTTSCFMAASLRDREVTGTCATSL